MRNRQHRRAGCQTLFPGLNYSSSGRRAAREMTEVVTPNCRATSANESLSVVTDSLGCGFGALFCYGMPS
jgi:hypothetical protein